MTKSRVDNFRKFVKEPGRYEVMISWDDEVYKGRGKQKNTKHSVIRTHGYSHALKVCETIYRLDKSVLSQYLFGDIQKDAIAKYMTNFWLHLYDSVEKSTLTSRSLGF